MMIVARFIGRVPVMIGSILFAILGIVLIVLGANKTPNSRGYIFIGIVLIVGAVLLSLAALSPDRARPRPCPAATGGPDTAPSGTAAVPAPVASGPVPTL